MFPRVDYKIYGLKEGNFHGTSLFFTEQSDCFLRGVLLPGKGQDILCFFPSMTSLNQILSLALLSAGSLGEFERDKTNVKEQSKQDFPMPRLKDKHLHFQKNEGK